MSADSLIQWTDHTFNPWYGCREKRWRQSARIVTSVETVPLRTRGMVHGSDRVRTSGTNWLTPYRWNRQAEAAGKPFKVFCLSLGDWLDNEVEITWVTDLLEVVRSTPNLIWQLLTKRPQNWRKRMRDVVLDADAHGKPETAEFADNWSTGKAPKNVWIGVSAGVEQSYALEIPAFIHFLSCEPMLHEMDRRWAAQFNWIIFGGESGKRARVCKLEWLRGGLAFCRQYGIPPFVKQLGANCCDGNERIVLKDSHGGDIAEWPADLRVREFPKNGTVRDVSTSVDMTRRSGKLTASPAVEEQGAMV